MRRKYRSLRYYDNLTKYNTVTEKLTLAFKILRGEGFVARKNYLCCQTCAGYALATKVSEMPDVKRTKVKGVVYYHNQDNNSFQNTGEVRLAYGPLDTKEYGTVGLPDVEVGKAVCDALKAVGLAWEWNGSGNTRILVKLPEPEPLDNGVNI